MDLSSRIGEARKQISIVKEKLDEDEVATRAILESVDERLEGSEAALEEADL